MDNYAIQLLYSNAFGRLLVKGMLKTGLPNVIADYLRSDLSRPLVPRYIRKYHISMEDFQGQHYRTFAEFFARKKEETVVDPVPSHFVSPADGWLSAYPIRPDSSFSIKRSYYRLCDLMDDPELAEKYSDGLCLIIRLTPGDYHHYSFIDDGSLGRYQYIEGMLHSVQPVACGKVPVYRLNRRCWTLLETEHFGPVVQVEIGALAVGGIVNNYDVPEFGRGDDKGYFALCGSTIVLLVEKGQIELLPEISSALETRREYRVSQGMWIASKCAEQSQTAAPKLQ